MNWTVVVPLKPLAEAKSRLRGACPGVPHERLVLALAKATITAIGKTPGVGRILVVTGDRTAAEALMLAGAEIAEDPGGGLNTALARTAAALTGPVAAMPADLAALRPEELDDALRAGGAYARWFAADARGTGTAVLACADGRLLDPRFGPASARAHEISGAVALDGAWPTLRHDVDTPADLAEARRLGLVL